MRVLFAAGSILCLALIALQPTSDAQPQPAGLSHPALREAPPPANRPLAKGPAFFVDANKGDDKNDGSEKAPWRTITHALNRLQAGHTLYLRGGTYYENVYVALAGKPDAPITLRSFPGEQAILDGGFREFFESPQTSWVPHAPGGKGEFRSQKSYPNLREILGSLGDSMIGLQTYYHAQDFRSGNELIDWEDWDNTAQSDLKPLYCGPGLWYDRATGHIHVRLAHTNLPEPVANYRGPTDPRQVPLVLAHYNSTPLHVDQARHVRFQDLIIRGSGYVAVKLDQAYDIDFDNVTIWCGTYGIRATGTQKLKFYRSALYGNVAPWTFRSDGSKRDYPGRPHRNISRLNTHALLEIEAGRESSVYATPFNDDWEISYSDFTDAHDALYLGGINVKFHHNLIDNMQDDGLYLSPMYHRHRLEKTDPQVHIYQNVFRQMLTALAFGGSEPATRDDIFIYRNIFDQRARVNTGRPSTKKPTAGFSTGKLIGDHGSPPWPTLMIYHNTFVNGSAGRNASMDTFGGTKAGNPRRVFNNIFLHFDRLPGFAPPDLAGNVIADGNLYWSPAAKPEQVNILFKKFRSSKLFTDSKTLYPPGSSSHDLAAEPLFVKAAADPAIANDYRLQAKSPAINAGVAIPPDWPDPLRQFDPGQPDIGASPHGAAPLQAGRTAASPFWPIQ